MLAWWAGIEFTELSFKFQNVIWPVLLLVPPTKMRLGTIWRQLTGAPKFCSPIEFKVLLALSIDQPLTLPS